MAKWIHSFIIPLLIMTLSTVSAQEQKKEFNELYKPIPLIKRLSYDNFKRIRMLHSAIMNYGGGEQEFDRLVDTYAEASALYFQNRIIDSANMFSRNEKDINKVSQKIAEIFKNDTDKLHTDIIKMGVKYNIRMSLEEKKPTPVAEKLLSRASFGLQKANDLFVRSRHIKAIFFFRRAKDHCFQMYNLLEIPLPEKFKKDQIDNQNKVYQSKKKQI